MKKIILSVIGILTILMTFSFTNFNFKSKNDKNEIIGTWIKRTDSKSSKKSTANNILEIEFKKDLTAKIKVSDSNGTRIITGKWSSTETKNFKKILGNNVKLLSDSIILEYLRNEKGMNLITLSKIRKNGKVQLKLGEVLFDKK